jgi:predicted molibdopterin-dependent oxidoreductase YjgC
MPTETVAPLFRPDAHGLGPSVELLFEGRPITAPAGISVAAALLMNGVTSCRDTPVSASPRAPYCMMGVCFDCLVEIDGIPALQACLTAVNDGMVVRKQHGAPNLAAPAGGADDAG